MIAFQQDPAHLVPR